MSEVIVTISGQRVYPRGQSPEPGSTFQWPDARDATGRPLALTEMSPRNWASGGNEETLEAGLPFLGAFVALVLAAVAAILLFGRKH